MAALLHSRQVVRALYYGQRWRLKRFLGLPDRPRNPVVDGDEAAAFARHLRICRLLQQGLSSFSHNKRGGIACEVGCGDCLSTADLFLGAGFERVYLVEKQPIVLDARQKVLLQRLADLPELPNGMACTDGGDPPQLSDRVRLVPEYFEAVRLPEKVDFIFSHDVLEHVEDLPGFFGKCAEIMAPGGVMLHKFDLSGHEFFEDPLPPLDFQTYPDWLYHLMFPKYRRACRWFLDEIVSSMQKAGFSLMGQEVLRAADLDYARKLRPLLRPEARKRSVDQLTPLDVVVAARRE